MMVSKLFKKKVIEYDVDSSAKSHLEAYAERYGGKSKADVREDLFVNHDNDAEVDNFEEWLGRKVDDKEREYFIDQFIKSVVKNYTR